jgi:hypothetical protein
MEQKHLPTKFGQSLIVEQGNKTTKYNGRSYDADGSIWFKTVLPFSTIIATADLGTNINRRYLNQNTTSSLFSQ